MTFQFGVVVDALLPIMDIFDMSDDIVTVEEFFAAYVTAVIALPRVTLK